MRYKTSRRNIRAKGVKERNCFVAEQCIEYGVGRLCRVLGLVKSSYYVSKYLAARNRNDKKENIKDDILRI